jgi:dihydrofolate reductase
MGKIVVTEFLTLDGVMEDPGGSENHPHGGWHFKFNDPVGGKFKLDETMAADAQLLGRVTYEGFAAAWPSRKDEAGFADKFNSMPKHVASTTLTELEWNNSHLLEGDVPDAVRRLKDQYEGDIVVAGSRTLVQTLIENDLVDEYRLFVDPIVVGGGKRLFPENGDAAVLELVSTQPLESGSVILTYRPARG